MEFWTEIPSLGRTELRDLKKGIDASFRSFSRAYGPEIEAFFEKYRPSSKSRDLEQTPALPIRTKGSHCKKRVPERGEEKGRKMVGQVEERGGKMEV